MITAKHLAQLQNSWNAWARQDPLFAILTIAGKKGRKWDKDEFFATGQEEIANLLEWLNTLKLEVRTHRALDFGCGVGRLTRALAKSFDGVCGVDISDEMIRLANELNGDIPNCKFLLNTSDRLDCFASETFDLVYSNIVLQHMHPKLAHSYIAEFMRVLSPCGIVVFTLPAKRLQYPFRDRVLDTIKYLIRPGLNQFERLFFRQEIFPEMLMKCTSAEEVLGLIEAAGGILIQSLDLKWGKPTWQINRYVATKNQAFPSVQYHT